MLHHLSFAVTDLARSAVFYDAALSALGYGRVWEDETAVGYGLRAGEDKFAIKVRSSGVAVPGEGFHVAFAAVSRGDVASFYKAALEHGGRDNGDRRCIPNTASIITPRLSLIQMGIA